MNSQKKYDVFISYSRKDLDEVSTFVEMLKTRIPTLEVWIDLEGITAADEFDEKIISAIDASSYVIFAVSPNSNSIGEGSSKWTKKELVYAKNTGKKVIPVLLSGAELNSWFLFEFGRVDCIDSSSTHQIEKLLKNIAKWSNKELVKPQKDKKVLTINERQFIDEVNIIKSRITHRKQIAKKVTMIVVPAMLFLITSISIGINRYKAYNGIAWEYNILNDSVLPYTAEISGFEFINEYKSSKISIPKKIKRNDTIYHITHIGNEAFEYYSSLTSITIPNSVTSIGEKAFYHCESLKSITIPESVTNIGKGILADCSSIKSIVVRKGNSTYDSRDHCNAIIETTSNMLIAGCQKTIIPEKILSIGESAFEGCEHLSSITIPNSVTNVERKAFDNCKSLKSITIPDGVTVIGEGAFCGCSSLKSAIIPNSITSIEEETYKGCSSLTSITIPNSVTNIGKESFSFCEALKSINIPKNVISIGECAFFGCHSLPSIVIPNNVATIGKEAFARCSSLTSIVVGSGNSTYDSRNSCNAIIETATNTLIAGCQSTIIPENVMSIGYGAFEGCDSLTFVTIPKSTTSIGDLAFWGCNSLSSLTLPEGLMSIGYCTFDVCWSLTSITIPNSVTSIGEGAFAGCYSLTFITLPNNITSIGNSTFQDCRSLTSITIPKSVTNIGTRAFADCFSLNDIKYTGTAQQLEKITYGHDWCQYIPAKYINCTNGLMRLPAEDDDLIIF